MYIMLQIVERIDFLLVIFVYFAIIIIVFCVHEAKKKQQQQQKNCMVMFCDWIRLFPRHYSSGISVKN